MQNKALIAAGVVVLVVAFLVFRGSGSDSDDDSATTTNVTTQATAAPQTVVVSGGKPEGGIQKLRFAKGDQVRFTVRSDVADEIHVHGYDLMKDVEAGGSVSFAFRAEDQGAFEVELEDRGEQIAQLEVR